MCMRRTHYSLPDYDDNAPAHGYANEIDARDSISDFPNEYGKDGGVVGGPGADGQYGDAPNMPHSSGKIWTRGATQNEEDDNIWM